MHYLDFGRPDFGVPLCLNFFQECDRLKKSLSAKDEMESKQIEAIRELSSANAKWEEANNQMASDLEDAHDKANGLRLSLETAYKEMGELKRGLMEKEDEAREAQLQKEVEAREKIERQAREDLVSFKEKLEWLSPQITQLLVSLTILVSLATFIKKY